MHRVNANWPWTLQSQRHQIYFCPWVSKCSPTIFNQQAAYILKKKRQKYSQLTLDTTKSITYMFYSLVPSNPKLPIHFITGLEHFQGTCIRIFSFWDMFKFTHKLWTLQEAIFDCTIAVDIYKESFRKRSRFIRVALWH